MGRPFRLWGGMYEEIYCGSHRDRRAGLSRLRLGHFRGNGSGARFGHALRAARRDRHRHGLWLHGDGHGLWHRPGVGLPRQSGGLGGRLGGWPALDRRSHRLCHFPMHRRGHRRRRALLDPFRSQRWLGPRQGRPRPERLVGIFDASAFIAEFAGTFLFLVVILGATSEKGSTTVAGVAIGVALRPSTST